MKNLCRLAYECEFDQSTQIIASGRTNETQVEHKSKTCVDLRRLASPFGQSSTGEGRGGEGRGGEKESQQRRFGIERKGKRKEGKAGQCKIESHHQPIFCSFSQSSCYPPSVP